MMPLSSARVMARTRSADRSLVLLDHGLFVSVSKTIQARLIEGASYKLKPNRKP